MTLGQQHSDLLRPQTERRTEGEGDESVVNEPVLVVLPDGAVRLYPHDAGPLCASDVLRDFPGTQLAPHSRGSHRPALAPHCPLRPGATYFLAALSGPSPLPSKPLRMSVDLLPPEGAAPRGEARLKPAGPDADWEGVRRRSFSTTRADCKWAYLEECDLLPLAARVDSAQPPAAESPWMRNPNHGTRAVQAFSPAPPRMPRTTASSPSSAVSAETAPSRRPLCPYCVPYPSLALSANWQVCALHSVRKGVVKSTSQTSASSLPSPRGAWYSPSPAPGAPCSDEADWLDCSCSITVTMPRAPSLGLPAGKDRVAISRRASLSPPKRGKKFNPILEELQQLEHSSARDSPAPGSLGNPILEELWHLEEEDRENACDGKGAFGRPPSRRVIGKIFQGVRRVAAWKPLRGGRSTEMERSEKPGVEQVTWNAMPARFTAV